MARFSTIQWTRGYKVFECATKHIIIQNALYLIIAPPCGGNWGRQFIMKFFGRCDVFSKFGGFWGSQSAESCSCYMWWHLLFSVVLLLSALVRVTSMLCFWSTVLVFTLQYSSFLALVTCLCHIVPIKTFEFGFEFKKWNKKINVHCECSLSRALRIKRTCNIYSNRTDELKFLCEEIKISLQTISYYGMKYSKNSSHVLQCLWPYFS